jgi:hypothetical protein
MLIRIVIIYNKARRTYPTGNLIHRAKVDGVLPRFKSVVLEALNSGTMAAFKTLT